MFSLKGVAEQKKVFRSLNTIIDRTHWVYGIPQMVLEFMELQFTKLYSELGQIG